MFENNFLISEVVVFNAEGVAYQSPGFDVLIEPWVSRDQMVYLPRRGCIMSNAHHGLTLDATPSG